jgi:glutaredoxin
MARVVMYSTVVCPYCQMAERLLKQRGVESIEKILIDREPGKREEMMTAPAAGPCRRSISTRPTWVDSTTVRARPSGRPGAAAGGLSPGRRFRSEINDLSD